MLQNQILQMNNYFKLFAFCKAVRGKEKSIVCNLQKAKIKFIPNSMYEVILLLESKPFDEVKSMFTDEHLNTFIEYIDFLLKNNLGFFTTEPERFPALNENWNTPEFINNAIFEYRFTNYDILQVIEQLNNLLCKHVELRIIDYAKANFGELSDILQKFEDTTIRSISLIFSDCQNISDADIKLLIAKTKKISALIFYSASLQKTTIDDDVAIQYIQEDFAVIKSKEFPIDKYIINIDYFMEALQFNPYYNKKICISEEGNIKNCLKHQAHFGNISTSDMQQIIQGNQFQKLWFASHDKIIDIKDSELRYNILISNNLKEVSPDVYSIVSE